MSLPVDAVSTVTRSGNVVIDLVLETNLAAEVTFPPYRLTLDFDWDLASEAPAIEFTDVEFDLVGFLKNFALPQLERINNSFRVLKPLLDFLGARPPLLFDMFGITNWADLAVVFSGTNNTAQFVDSVKFIGELVEEIPALTGTSWISLGSFSIDPDVARAAPGASDDPLISASAARPWLPEGAVPEISGGGVEITAAVETSEEFKTLLSANENDSVYGEIFQQTFFLSPATKAAAEAFIKTQELPGRAKGEGVGATSFGDALGPFSFGFPNSITRFAGIFGDGPTAPIHFGILEDPSNSFRLLLGDTGFGRKGGTALTPDKSLLLDYQMPDLSLIIATDVPANPWEVLAKFILGVGTALEDENDSDKRAKEKAQKEEKAKDPDGKKKKSGKVTNFLKSPANWVFKVYFDADYAYGFDASGLDVFKRTGDAGAIENGFFIDDTVGVGSTFGGGPLIGTPDPNNVEILLGVGLDFSIGGTFGPITLQAGLSPQLRFGGTMDLTDRADFGPADGRVRAFEFDLNVDANDTELEGGGAYNYGLKLDVLVTAAISVGIDFGLFTVDVLNFGITIITPPLLEFEFDNDDIAGAPVLGVLQGTTLVLNVGDRAIHRGFLESEINETFRLGAGDAVGEVIVAFGGLAQTFQGVTVISADGGSGNDTIIVSDAVTAKAILLGGVGMDMLVGGGGGDEIDGGLGDDTIIGGLGDDILRGSAGLDRLYGRSGVDELHGGLGRDDLFGDEGDDDLFGDEGDDNLFGGAGNDDLFGGAGGDTLQGEGGQDTLRGEAGGDKLLGGNDELRGLRPGRRRSARRRARR